MSWIQKIGAAGRFGGGLIGRSRVAEPTKAAGLWTLRHYRPATDADARAARERNQMEQSLVGADRSLREKLRLEIARIDEGIRREMIGEEAWENLVVNVGLNYLLDAGLSGGTPITTWYVGLKDTGTPVAGDTMASHASWATLTVYSNTNDPQWQDGGVSGQSVDNSSTPASFNINGTDDIYGAFLKSTNTKGGTAGSLYAAGDFAAARSVTSGDTLEVTATFTAS